MSSVIINTLDEKDLKDILMFADRASQHNLIN